LNLSQKTCPECGSNLLEDTSRQSPPRCTNPDCPAEVRAALARWCAAAAMSIAGTDEKLIAQLVSHGLVLDVADFYRLKHGELMELEDMTETTAKDFLAAIAESKTLDWWRMLAGLGLPHVNAEAAPALAQTFKNLDDLAHAPRTRLLAVTDEMMADGIAECFSDSRHRNLLKRLRQAGLKLD
jgi:DNA ligase (NAD+)